MEEGGGGYTGIGSHTHAQFFPSNVSHSSHCIDREAGTITRVVLRRVEGGARGVGRGFIQASAVILSSDTIVLQVQETTNDSPKPLNHQWYDVIFQRSPNHQITTLHCTLRVESRVLSHCHTTSSSPPMQLRGPPMQLAIPSFAAAEVLHEGRGTVNVPA